MLFTVAQDVVVSGLVVVSQGTLAVGQVTQVKKGGFPLKRGILKFTIEGTQTIGGHPLAFNAEISSKADVHGTEIALEVFQAVEEMEKDGGSSKNDDLKKLAELKRSVKGKNVVIPAGTSFEVLTQSDQTVTVTHL